MEAEKANVRAEQLKLGYCSINAPISGRIGDTLVTEGNLIAGGAASPTLLTTLFSVDPMFVTFDVDENTLQRLQKVEREGRVQLGTSEGEIPAEASPEATSASVLLRPRTCRRPPPDARWTTGVHESDASAPYAGARAADPPRRTARAG